MSFHGALTSAMGQVLGLTLIIAAIAGGAAFAYQWAVRERIPDGLAILIGLSVVAVSVGATGWLGQVIGGSDSLLSARVALVNIGVFVVCGGASVLGARVGDRLARDLAGSSGTSAVEAEVGKLVEAVGRVITVELPEEIEDVVGYDPVPAASREELAGKRFLFPRRLTVGELRERLIARLETDYAVGHVDMELADDGTVEYLALGSRAAGIGPTLPPETAAVAIRADPAHAASAGDLVQVWETNPSRRILTAELRGVAGDVVTLAIDAADTPKLDGETRYRLVTLPVEDRPDREFASLLRAAEETMATVEVETGSSIVGATIGDVGVTVATIADSERESATLPTADRPVAAGDVLYAIAAPEALRKLEAAATAESGGGAGTPPAGGPGSAADQGATASVANATDATGAEPPEPDESSASVDVDASERPIQDQTPVFEPAAETDPLDDRAGDGVAGEPTADEGDRRDDASEGDGSTGDDPMEGDPDAPIGGKASEAGPEPDGDEPASSADGTTPTSDDGSGDDFPDDGAADDVAEDGAVDDVAEDGAVDDVAEDGVAEDGAVDDVAEDGAADDGAEDGAADDGANQSSDRSA